MTSLCEICGACADGTLGSADDGSPIDLRDVGCETRRALERSEIERSTAVARIVDLAECRAHILARAGDGPVWHAAEAVPPDPHLDELYDRLLAIVHAHFRLPEPRIAGHAAVAFDRFLETRVGAALRPGPAPWGPLGVRTAALERLEEVESCLEPRSHGTVQRVAVAGGRTFVLDGSGTVVRGYRARWQCPEPCREFFVSRRGDQIAMVGVDVYLAHDARPRPLRVEAGSRTVLHGAFTPDGRFVVFVHERGLRVMTPHGELLCDRTTEERWLVAATNPEATAMYGVAARKGSHQPLVRIALSGERRVLAELSPGTETWSSIDVHPSSALVAVASPSSVALVEVATGRLWGWIMLESRVAADAVYVRFHPDGQWLLVSVQTRSTHGAFRTTHAVFDLARRRWLGYARGFDPRRGHRAAWSPHPGPLVFGWHGDFARATF